jgi:hypothetical protein
LLKPRGKIIYHYDFGDDWMHEVLVEKSLQESPSPAPFCIEGDCACPPEDSGGPWGYVEKLEALRDRRHPEHEEIRGWMGRGFDPEAFDVKAVNKRLQKKPKAARTRAPRMKTVEPALSADDLLPLAMQLTEQERVRLALTILRASLHVGDEAGDLVRRAKHLLARKKALASGE